MSLLHQCCFLKVRDLMPLSKEDQDRVNTILVNELDVDERELIPLARLFEDLGADDFEMVDIAMALEEEFEIEVIPQKEFNGLETVEDLYQLVERLVK